MEALQQEHEKLEATARVRIISVLFLFFFFFFANFVFLAITTKQYNNTEKSLLTIYTLLQ